MKKIIFKQMQTQDWGTAVGFHGPLGLRVLITEAATILGVSRRTIWNWQRRGLMPPSKRRGARISYLRNDIVTLASIVGKNSGGKNV